MKEFGKHLKKLADDKGVSLNYLAKKCGLNQGNLSRVANGQDIKLSSIEKLARELDVPLVQMFTFASETDEGVAEEMTDYMISQIESAKPSGLDFTRRDYDAFLSLDEEDKARVLDTLHVLSSRTPTPT